MNRETTEIAAIARACAASDPRHGTEDLLSGLGEVWPQLTFRTVLTRSGWYRSGGVVDIDKQRIADSLRAWAEAAAADALQPLLDSCLQKPLFATRLAGRTHYLTAPTGRAAADFIQLEVEELQEVLERYLSDPDWLPESIEEFIDPLEYAPLEPEPVGSSRLVFRRFFAAREMLNPLEARPHADLTRFMQDWEKSSASQVGHFCNQWVFGVRETTDSDGETRVSAHPIAACVNDRNPPSRDISGAELATWVHSFDQAAGYPMAWYFHMVASAAVPHVIGMQVADDHNRDFSYLPVRDLEVLHRWMDAPYSA
jgi:hypothetical protein